MPPSEESKYLHGGRPGTPLRPESEPRIPLRPQRTWRWEVFLTTSVRPHTCPRRRRGHTGPLPGAAARFPRTRLTCAHQSGKPNATMRGAPPPSPSPAAARRAGTWRRRRRKRVAASRSRGGSPPVSTAAAGAPSRSVRWVTPSAGRRLRRTDTCRLSLPGLPALERGSSTSLGASTALDWPYVKGKCGCLKSKRLFSIQKEGSKGKRRFLL